MLALRQLLCRVALTLLLMLVRLCWHLLAPAAGRPGSIKKQNRRDVEVITCVCRSAATPAHAVLWPCLLLPRALPAAARLPPTGAVPCLLLPRFAAYQLLDLLQHLADRSSVAVGCFACCCQRIKAGVQVRVLLGSCTALTSAGASRQVQFHETVICTSIRMPWIGRTAAPTCALSCGRLRALPRPGSWMQEAADPPAS